MMASIEMRVNVPWRLGATRTGARFATVANILLTSVEKWRMVDVSPSDSARG